MDLTSRLTRRTFGRCTLISAAAIVPVVPGSAALARLQDVASPWHSADGLRLVGPVEGLTSLDPALSRDLSTNFLLRQVFRGLVNLDNSLTPVPGLAERIDTSNDGLRYTFTLRENARFHDGRTIEPEDVRFSLTRALNPDIAGGDPGGLAAITYLRDILGADEVISGTRDSLTGLEVTGERSLQITLGRHSPTFLMKLASVPASIVDARQVSEHDEWTITPNGSGPYAVSSWDPDKSIELESSETWWSGKAYVERVSVRLGVDASQPFNLFQGGDIDLLYRVPADLIGLIEDPASGVAYGNLIETDLFATSYIAFGNGTPPLDDAHVRRALQLVFPSELVAAATFNGSVLAAAGLLPPGMLGESWAVERGIANAEAAREELTRSRYGSGAKTPPIAIHAADISEVESLRDVAAEELGLTIEAIHVGWNEFLQGLSERRFAAYSLYWGADYPDPESMIEMLFGADSVDNYTGYQNPELESLLEIARSTEGPERIAAFSQANQLLVDDAALIPLYHPVGYTLVREGIPDVDVTPMGILGLETIEAVS